MQPHLLVSQLRFSRSELVRGLEGLTADDAVRRFMPMNCISWIVGHLADQEHRYWVIFAQGKNIVPDLNDLVGHGKPASSPALEDMWTAWHKVTEAADAYLETLTPEILISHLARERKPIEENVGTLLMRNIYHYWYHTGEASAIRQMMGHSNLPEFVGDINTAAYHPEN